MTVRYVNHATILLDFFGRNANFPPDELCHQKSKFSRFGRWNNPGHFFTADLAAGEKSKL